MSPSETAYIWTLRGQTYLSLDVWDDETESGPVDWNKLGIIGSFRNDMKECYFPWDAENASESITALELQDFFMRLALGLEKNVVLLTWIVILLLVCFFYVA